MKRIKLTRQEKVIENSLLKQEYANVSKKEFDSIAESIVARKKDAVLNIRVNSRDLSSIKQKAKKFGVKYQTFISELLHKVAQA
ncbi:MAG: hypothetical protein HQ558_06430 [Candidatus Omnitrophica bacterium]|nr:hypothetical protein [Candidatus Omnitrophota bacterium]